MLFRSVPVNTFSNEVPEVIYKSGQHSPILLGSYAVVSRTGRSVGF